MSLKSDIMTEEQRSPSVYAPVFHKTFHKSNVHVMLIVSVTVCGVYFLCGVFLLERDRGHVFCELVKYKSN